MDGDVGEEATWEVLVTWPDWKGAVGYINVTGAMGCDVIGRRKEAWEISNVE